MIEAETLPKSISNTDTVNILTRIEKLRLMVNATGYSALLVTLYVLLMVGVGLAFFLILLAAI